MTHDEMIKAYDEMVSIYGISGPQDPEKFEHFMKCKSEYIASRTHVLMSPKVLRKLKKFAERSHWYDDEDMCVYDYSGSNVDDAFESGTYLGEIRLAREILDELNIEYEIEED